MSSVLVGVHRRGISEGGATWEVVEIEGALGTIQEHTAGWKLEKILERSRKEQKESVAVFESQCVTQGLI